MNNYLIDKYLTFEEVLGIFLNNVTNEERTDKNVVYFDFKYNETINWSGVALNINSMTTGQNALFELCKAMGLSNKWFTYEDSQYILNDNVKELINVLFNKYSEAYVLKYNDFDFEIKSHNLTKFSVILWKFFVKFINKIDSTFIKYSKLMDLYKAQENNLLKGVGSSYTDETSGDTSGTSRFNDTPQDSGDFSDDAHTSSLTQNTSEASSTIEHEAEDDRYTLMERLEKVQNAYLNVIEAWAREFKGFFYLMINLEVL